mmetsp:Transcript_3659/g.6967  ORF Transcript_3659/g.6967 Transcript_3659/m.6967 type:complete len:209 (+) Transcript_3659:167-793(+)
MSDIGSGVDPWARFSWFKNLSESVDDPLDSEELADAADAVVGRDGVFADVWPVTTRSRAFRTKRARSANDEDHILRLRVDGDQPPRRNTPRTRQPVHASQLAATVVAEGALAAYSRDREIVDDDDDRESACYVEEEVVEEGLAEIRGSSSCSGSAPRAMMRPEAVEACQRFFAQRFDSKMTEERILEAMAKVITSEVILYRRRKGHWQ